MDAEATIRTVFFRDDAGAGPADRTGPRAPIVLAVAALHIALLSALCALSQARRPPPPPAEVSIPVVFAPAAPAPSDPAPEILASSTLPVPAAHMPALLTPSPLSLPPSHLASRPRSARRVTATPVARNVPADSPPAAAESMQRLTTPPAAAAPASHDRLREMANWEARIRQAVQAAAIFPASARLLHRQGSAQVRFDYDRGVVESAAIAQSSHFGALDDAALAAVTHAAIPDPPAVLGPQTRTMLVWVQFTLLPVE